MHSTMLLLMIFAQTFVQSKLTYLLTFFSSTNGLGMPPSGLLKGHLSTCVFVTSYHHKLWVYPTKVNWELPQAIVCRVNADKAESTLFLELYLNTLVEEYYYASPPKKAIDDEDLRSLDYNEFQIKDTLECCKWRDSF